MAYLLFAGENYYPKGGAEDMQGSFDTLYLAIAGHDPLKHPYDGWAHVLCLSSLKIVKDFYGGTWHEHDENS